MQKHGFSTEYVGPELLKDLLISEGFGRLTNIIKLGSGESNVGTARNLGALLSPPGICVFLDDDVITLCDVYTVLKKYKVEPFAGFRLCGFLDLSNLEWIEAYLLHLSKKYRVLIKNDNSYIEKILSSDAFKRIVINFPDILATDGYGLSKKPLPARECTKIVKCYL